jgi:segregation and condensation protein B
MLNAQEAKLAELAATELEQPEIYSSGTAIVNRQTMRVVEALLFAAPEPVDQASLARLLPPETDIAAVLSALKDEYSGRGVNLVQVAGKWQFRTAADLAFLLRKESIQQHKLSRAAIETLAIIAYHQPTTRAEIEDIRGVMVSKGTLDALLETGWIRIRGRRRTPGRPVTYGTTEAFLAHFGLEQIGDLPGLEDLRAAGFLDSIPPSGFSIPQPSDAPAPDEDPYDAEDPATDSSEANSE